MKRITLTQFLVSRQRDKNLINADLRLLIETIARACKGISTRVNKGALAEGLGSAMTKNVHGEAQKTLDDNASLLKKYPSWAITIEGHCDERGTPEYNLALGERRAVAARAYLLSLGIAADRLRTVSYGKEFPFDPGHDEAAWAKNRRAHFVVTAK